MAITGSVSGVITVGEPNNPDVSINISPVTGSVTEYQRGKMVLATTEKTPINMGGVAVAELVWLKIYNQSTGAPVLGSVFLTDITGETEADETNEILRNLYGSASGISACSVQMPAATETVVEYLFVGTPA